MKQWQWETDLNTSIGGKYIYIIYISRKISVDLWWDFRDTSKEITKGTTKETWVYDELLPTYIYIYILHCWGRERKVRGVRRGAPEKFFFIITFDWKGNLKFWLFNRKYWIQFYQDKTYIQHKKKLTI